MALLVNTSISMVMASTVLHNFLRQNSASRAMYSPPGSFVFEDTDTSIIVPDTCKNKGEVEDFRPLRGVPRKSTFSVKKVQEEIAEIFRSEQEMYLGRTIKVRS
ncbi:hypothetical protein ANN_08516 [Periplaneta americana]|uniref:Uncharacterized protein n=1 Tax=Periplaneta americana TaxID=6978 RepID=A0ABQ8T378_PERAM|nr:hypothetical protein ANN_08516 [Periplaneta americana]